MTKKKDQSQFDKLVQTGRELLKEDDPYRAHSAFNQWDRDVADWLDEN
jgi:hypothetical protein